MEYETVTVRRGTNCGPVDWSHPTAVDMPEAWREAEKNPGAFRLHDDGAAREIVCVCMYDGWPYWTPRPAVLFIGPLKLPEWTFFDSYGVRKNSVRPFASPYSPLQDDAEAPVSVIKDSGPPDNAGAPAPRSAWGGEVNR